VTKEIALVTPIPRQYLWKNSLAETAPTRSADQKPLGQDLLLKVSRNQSKPFLNIRIGVPYGQRLKQEGDGKYGISA
jgi:hypothetical protein